MEDENKKTEINDFEPKRTGMHIKNTTYLVGIHFNDASEQQIEEKMKALIIKDVGHRKKI